MTQIEWESLIKMGNKTTDRKKTCVIITRAFLQDWVSNVAGKQAAYHAMAEYHQAMVAKEKKEFGEEIARLTVTWKFYFGYFHCCRQTLRQTQKRICEVVFVWFARKRIS